MNQANEPHTLNSNPNATFRGVIAPIGTPALKGSEPKKWWNVFQENPEKVVIGRIQRPPFFKEKLTPSEMNHHVHIVGASGYGKTVLLMHILKQKIQTGKGLMFVDLKGDVETITKIKRYVTENGREQDLQIFSLSDAKSSSPYNLIGSGTPTQIRDRIMMSFEWSEEFYKNQSASFLLKLLIGLCHIRDRYGLTFSLSEILKALNDQTYVQGLLQKIQGEGDTAPRAFLEECEKTIGNSTSSNNLQGLRTQLESLVHSDFGSLVTATDCEGIDLFKAYRESKIVIVILDSRRYGETARAIGRFILQDLKATSSRVDDELTIKRRKPFSIVIDEFADLASEDFISFLDRARSSKMSIVVAHQELCDLDRISPEFAGRLMGNTSTLYAFLQKRPESAEIISGMAGTKTVWKSTQSTERVLFFEVPNGKGSKRQVEEFNIHPNTIKSLGVGMCVVVKKYPTARSHIVKVARDA